MGYSINSFMRHSIKQNYRPATCKMSCIIFILCAVGFLHACLAMQCPRRPGEGVWDLELPLIAGNHTQVPCQSSKCSNCQAMSPALFLFSWFLFVCFLFFSFFSYSILCYSAVCAGTSYVAQARLKLTVILLPLSIAKWTTMVSHFWWNNF